MESLRRAPLLARLVLAWFALTLCVGVAASVHEPQGLLAGICSVSGDATGAAPGDDAGGPSAAHGAHCLLCISPGLTTALSPAPLLPAMRAEAPSRWVAVGAPPRRLTGPAAARAPPAQG